MATLSVPLTPELEDFIEKMIMENKADNKAQVVRRALHEFRENELFREVLEAQSDISRGRVYSGNLRDLINKLD